MKTRPRNYRLVVIFPEPDLVRFILLEEHTNTSDPYAWLEEIFGLAGRDSREAGAGKPSCCSDRSEPPEGAALAELLDELAVQWRARR